MNDTSPWIKYEDLYLIEIGELDLPGGKSPGNMTVDDIEIRKEDWKEEEGDGGHIMRWVANVKGISFTILNT